MKLRIVASHVALVTAAAALAACSTGPATSALPAKVTTGSTQTIVRKTQNLRAFAADCSSPAATSTTASCTNIELATLNVLGAGTPASQIPGYKPADLISAYKLPSTGGTGQTLAVVTANQAPNAAADLAVYRSTFGLPPCTTTNGCLQIVKDDPNIQPDVQWSREAATDLDMASAVCPHCSLLFVEAKSSIDNDLAHAVQTAVRLGAKIVSLSFTVPEGPGESNGMWNQPRVTVVAAAGDGGYGLANWPAASTNVVAVGATTLLQAPSTARGWTETAWTGTGSGCSQAAPKPSWQKDTACTKRTIADVAAVGDPNTPVAIYNSYQDNGWVQVGGTSVSTPIIAAIFALAGNATTVTGANSLYANQSQLFPIVGGSNGACAAAYLCTANATYSGPGGLGSPNGIAAF
jgi:subtilase family serine protease